MAPTLRVVLIGLAVVVCVAQAQEYCLRHKIRSQCTPAEIKEYCVPVTSCQPGETFITGGGMCSCDVCVRYVGLGDSCVVGGTSYPFCRYPYRCNTQHKCVSACSYS